MKTASKENRYSVPALDKGLDIVELLAGRPEGLSLKQIADALGRTPTEIFRMLNHLLHRTYVRRFEPGGIYRLSLKLFELAHRFPPTARLLEVAVPAMRQLADRLVIFRFCTETKFLSWHRRQARPTGTSRYGWGRNLHLLELPPDVCFWHFRRQKNLKNDHERPRTQCPLSA
jgi:DNA-binding Lrp family transcriptional regulator